MIAPANLARKVNRERTPEARSCEVSLLASGTEIWNPSSSVRMLFVTASFNTVTSSALNKSIPPFVYRIRSLVYRRFHRRSPIRILSQIAPKIT